MSRIVRLYFRKEATTLRQTATTLQTIRTALTTLVLESSFGTTDWSAGEATEHAGESGTARWRTRQFGTVRVRMVDDSPGFRGRDVLHRPLMSFRAKAAG